MQAALITLTLVEVLLFVGVLAGYLIGISRSLRRTVTNLARVGFGVRAIETQTAGIGPSVVRINEQLRALSAAFERVADAAAATSSRARRRG